MVVVWRTNSDVVSGFDLTEAKLPHGSTRWPLGAISSLKVSVPVGNESLMSSGPHMCSWRLTMSSTHLFLRIVWRPISPGRSEFATTGVVKVPFKLPPLALVRPIGSVQLWVQVWLPLPTPMTLSGLGRRACDGALPLEIATWAHSCAHLSPPRFPTDPGSMSRTGLPSGSLVPEWYVPVESGSAEVNPPLDPELPVIGAAS